MVPPSAFIRLIFCLIGKVVQAFPTFPYKIFSISFVELPSIRLFK